MLPKRQAQRGKYPDIVLVFNVEFDGAFCDFDVDVDLAPLLQIAAEGADFDFGNVYDNLEVEVVEVDGADDLRGGVGQLLGVWEEKGMGREF